MEGSGGGSAYWDACGWDPDERVYVGTDQNQGASGLGLGLLNRSPFPAAVGACSVGSTSSGSGYWDQLQGAAAQAVASSAPAPPMAAPAPGQTTAPMKMMDDSSPKAMAQVSVDAKAPGMPMKPKVPSLQASPSPALSRGGSSIGSNSDYWDAGGWGTGAAARPPPRITPAAGAVAGAQASLGRASGAGPFKPMSRRSSKGSHSNSIGGLAGGGQRRRSSRNSSSGVPGRLKVNEVNSDAYWDAGQWDPDERVYVGAADGATNHLRAVDPSQMDATAAKLSAAWAGGLLSVELNLDKEVGAPIDLGLLLQEDRPALKDIYDISDRSVGSGSFGVVRRAVHKKSKEQCVVKAVRKVSAGDQYRLNLVEGVLGETLLRMTKELPHDNVTRYLDLLEGPQHYYVIMEELSGPELLQHMEELFPVTEYFIHGVMRQILSALAHIHDVVHLFHRDVKLANFRFRGPVGKSSLVLLDFGFASSTEKPWDGSVCGTTMFMSPELVAHLTKAPFLQAMDLWAAGVILFVLLTGDSPFEDAQVKSWGRQSTAFAEARELVEHALVRQELSCASAPAIALLRGLLVAEPEARLTAEQALKQPWFVTAEPPPTLRLSVPSERYRLVRSGSRTPSNMSGNKSGFFRRASVPSNASARAASGSSEGGRSWAVPRSNSTPNLGNAGADGAAGAGPGELGDEDDPFNINSTATMGLARIVSAGDDVLED